MNIKKGDKVKLKPIPVCRPMTPVFLHPRMEHFWNYPYLTVKVIEPRYSMSGKSGGVIMVKEDYGDEWVFDLQWIDHIIHDNHFPDDNLFTLED